MHRNGVFKVFSFLIILLILMGSFMSVQAVGPVQEDDPGTDEAIAQLITPQEAEIIPDNYIIVMKPTFGVAKNIDSITNMVSNLGGEVGFVYDNVINGFSATLPPQALAALRRNPNVEFIEADSVVRTFDESDIEDEFETLGGRQPNPTWGLDRIDQRNLPLDNSYYYSNTASSTRAYILDTGIRRTHIEFGGRIGQGFTAINDGRGINDCDGHGTHVAGTVGGDLYGVAKRTTLHPVRVLDCYGRGTTSGVIAGVNWVANNHIKPAVANMSLGGGASPTLDSAVNGLIDRGVTVVVAAGNSNANACNYSPARVGRAITVGATTSADARAVFSNWGTCVDVFAPGSSITSAYHWSDTATSTASGTSMAAPHVAGGAAIYLQADRNASPATVKSFIIGNATRNKISNPGTNSPNLLLFSVLPPPIPTAWGPNGYVVVRQPTYSFTRVLGATSYNLELYKRDRFGVEELVYSRWFLPGICGIHHCMVKPNLSLANGHYWYRVRAMVGGTLQGWSNEKPFIVYWSPEWSSNFENNAHGWVRASGGWHLVGGFYRGHQFTPNNWFSIVREHQYPTFTYTAHMYRHGSLLTSNALRVRGRAWPLESNNDWNNYYSFAYANDGYFSVHKIIDGNHYTIQNWTWTSAINQYGWNTLRVVGEGGTFRFFINGSKVWEGFIADRPIGYVGIAAYQWGGDPDWSPLFVSWSNLQTSAISSAEDVWAEMGETLTDWDNPTRSKPDP